MGSARCWSVTWVGLILLVAACQGSTDNGSRSSSNARPSAMGTGETAEPVLVPNLLGLASAKAMRSLGEIEASAHIGLSSQWGRPIIVRCDARPRIVARQEPAPGTPLEPGTVVRVHTTALDLEQFRGPCEPSHGDLGPVAGADAALARQFYRFSADPALGAGFGDGAVWAGIESGPTATILGKTERADLTEWQLHTGYAERSGPFSALDIVASSGGYYELHRGIAPTCPSGSDSPPPGLASLRAISLTAPSDTTASCMEWWGVTLFLDDEDTIRGVALRLGSP